jgi:predicted Zn-dependent protease
VDRKLWKRGRAWAAVMVTLAAAACATNPVTGRRELALVSEAQEIQLGRETAAQAAQQIGLVPDSALQQYVQRIGAELAAGSQRPNLPWTFRVVDDPTPNAFALPGGFIFITRGLMSLMDSEAELAAVLGHEIGHVTARHSVQQISRAQLAQLGLGVGSILFPSAAQTFGNLASGGLQLLFLRYGRDAERQADELGFAYALSEGFDVREMDDVFAQLQRASEAERKSALPSWLSTHPAPTERIQAVQQRISATQLPPNLRAGTPEYMGRIDGLVYGENPRQGFFEEGRFLHPDLRFQLRFPAQWQTQNLAQSVSAISPRQDAMLTLTLAQGSGADAAARAFLGQQGISPGRTTRETINGIPAVVGYFQAQTQQGVITGMAAFLDYGGNTYQLLAYTPAQAFGAYEGLFRQVIGSFAPLTDQRALSVRPERIDVVRLPRAMTLTEFARAYPSSQPIETLVLINQVTGANATLPAGALVKRVVRG